MVTKTTKNNSQLFTRRPGFALRMLKLAFTYLTGMINHIPFLPETIKNKLNLVKNTENNNNVLPIKSSSSMENTSKTVKTENKNNSNIEFPVYISEKIQQATCDYRNKRPSSLKFNNNNSSSAGDSGVSDLSCSNSNVSTPEIEFRTRNKKSSRSRNRKKSQNNNNNNNSKIITDQSNNTEQQQVIKNSNIVNIEQEKVAEVEEETVQNKQTTKVELKNTESVQRNSTKNNILFDLPDQIQEINLLENEEKDLESDEIDEELERFKMYCQETNKLFDLNDSKIVIKWETI